MCAQFARYLALFCAVLVSAMSQISSSCAQDQPSKAKIILTLFATDRSGMTRVRALSDGDLRPGESRTVLFYSSADGRSGAVSEVGTIGRANEYQYSWLIKSRLVSTGVDSVTFEMDWQRSGLAGGEWRVAAGDHRTITLREGDRHALDFMACNPVDSLVANVLLEATASPVEDPVYAEAKLGYDLWLVHQGSDGSRVTRHMLITGRQGEKLPFEFVSVPLPLEDPVRADAGSPFEMYVYGTIAGRVATDGSIQVALHSQESCRPKNGTLGLLGGTKTFSVKDGESISVELPQRNGYSTVKPNAGFSLRNSRNGITILKDGRLQIGFEQFFAGSKTSIILTIHSER